MNAEILSGMASNISAHPVLVVMSLLSGLLTGELVDLVSVRLPAAMKQAWVGVDDDFARREAIAAPASTSTVPGIDMLPGRSLQGNVAPDRQRSTAATDLLTQRVRCGRTARNRDGGRHRIGGQLNQKVDGCDARLRFIRSSCGAAFVLLAARFGPTPILVAAMAATALLMVLAVIDWRNYLLPDIIVYPFLSLGLIVNIPGAWVPLQDSIVGAAFGYSSLWILESLYRSIFIQRGIGHGDLKLLAALGAWLGWKALFSVTVVAVFFASLFKMASMLNKSRKEASNQLPFGAHLAAAGWIVLTCC